MEFHGAFRCPCVSMSGLALSCTSRRWDHVWCGEHPAPAAPQHCSLVSCVQARCPAQMRVGIRPEQTCDIFPRCADLATTQPENLLSHDTADPGSVLKVFPAKLCGFTAFLLKQMLARLLPAPGNTSNLLPSLSGKCWGAERARDWGDLTAL